MTPPLLDHLSLVCRGGNMGRNVSLQLKLVNGATLAVSVPSSSTVSALKKIVAEKESIPVDKQRIIYAGKELDDVSTLAESEVDSGAQMFVVVRTAKGLQIHVKTLKDRFFIINADQTTTVLDVKQRVAEQDPQWEVARQRMIFQGKELQDSKLIVNCGLHDETPTVHLVMRPPAPGTARRRKDDNSVKSSSNAKSKSRSSPVVKVESSACASPEDDYRDCRVNGDLITENIPMEFETAWSEFEVEARSTSASAQWENAVNLMPTGGHGNSPGSDESLAVIEALDVSAIDLGTLPSSSSPVFTDMVANSKVESYEELPVPSTQGRAYDLSKVDEKLRKRLLKNRLSAERSRQRKQAHVESLEFELSCCRSENEYLKKKVASLEAQLAALTMAAGTNQNAYRKEVAVS
eukprot:750407-Hanusia_phi.AAC.1